METSVGLPGSSSHHLGGAHRRRAKFGLMTVELTQEVYSRLTSDNYGWLTTVAKSGQPVPRLIWFYFDGTKLRVYSMPQAAKVAHIKAHPQVSLNLDSDGNGGGIIAVDSDDDPSGFKPQRPGDNNVASFVNRSAISIWVDHQANNSAPVCVNFT